MFACVLLTSFAREEAMVPSSLTGIRLLKRCVPYKKAHSQNRSLFFLPLRGLVAP